MSDYDYTSIVLSQLNATVSGQNNTLLYQLPSGLNTEGYEMCIAQSNVYYSWYNITTAYGNNQIGYINWDGTATTVTLPSGFYQINDIGAYLQTWMNSMGYYLVNSAGKNVYYLSLVANPAYYRTTLSITTLPTTLPTNWTNPNNINLATYGGKGPQLVLNNTGMQTLLGFNSGTYPAMQPTTSYQVNGANIPQITKVTSVNILCNLCITSPYNALPGVVMSFSPAGTAFGALISISPPELLWYKTQTSRFSYIQVTLVDQNCNALQMQDPQMSFTLTLRKKLK
jgi:hypothetical protein